MGSLIQRKKKIMMMQRDNGLPSAYRQVEYIESAGHGLTEQPWIDTGIIPDKNTKSLIKFMVFSVSNEVIYGYYQSSDNADYRLFNSSTSGYFDLLSQRINSGSVASIPANYVWEFELGNYYMKRLADATHLEGIVSGISQEFNGDNTITLGYYKNGTRIVISKIRWYYVKIYSGDILIRDMIPCVRLSDNAVGMYDLVSKHFFGSENEYNYTAGNPV